MEAKMWQEIVLSTEQMLKIGEKARGGSTEQESVAASLGAIAKAQAEISFKVGQQESIREVIRDLKERQDQPNLPLLLGLYIESLQKQLETVSV